MDLLYNIDNSLVEKRLHTIKEAGKRSRLRPAVIIMKRGTIIEADHARQVNHPKTGTPMIVLGIQPGLFPRWANRYQNINPQKASLIGKMRDFATVGRYVPATAWIYRQDETGWSEPDENGEFNAHRDYQWNNKFRHIMTAFMENVQEVRWVHEAENTLRNEPDKFDYRGQHSRSWATKSLLDIFHLEITDAIKIPIIHNIIAGVNSTIAARSQYLGIDQAVELLDLVPGDEVPSAIIAQWKSKGHKGSSVIPTDMSAAELAAFLEEESADYWNSP